LQPALSNFTSCMIKENVTLNCQFVSASMIGHSVERTTMCHYCQNFPFELYKSRLSVPTVTFLQCATFSETKRQFYNIQYWRI